MSLLSKIRVVDFTSAGAGPYCTMLLGDLGAEVIKVEPPSGDHGRYWGSWQVDKKSALFLAMNRNKNSVVLDLTTEAGRADALKLIKSADVVVESMAPGGAEKFGIDYESVRRHNPKLVYLSVSGFGRTGPQSHELGMDMMLQAYTGMLSFNGEPGRPPVRIAVSAIDLTTGSAGVSAVLASLMERSESGKGQRIEVSLYDTAMNLLAWAIPQYSATGKEPQKYGAHFEWLHPYGVYGASDGYFYLGVSTPAHWKRFCAVMTLDDLVDDERFSSNSARLDRRDELVQILEPLFARRTVDDLVAAFKGAGIPAGTIRTVGQAVEDDHAVARGMAKPLPGYPQVKVAGTIFKLERGLRDEWLSPPDLGEHTEAYVSGGTAQ